ncbi:MAG: glycosyltransferase [Bacilli bacterium]|nr:glycosyltransferase [Bacilli bacterium]
MGKYKVCVYAICKNEEKFVKCWVNSMKEADEVYVLDTGSTDNTVKYLKKAGVNVSVEVIKPWRFDVARNKSLELVPKDTDICVCTDLDEVFESGWREKLENAYISGSRVSYTYNWHINENGVADVSFMLNKIHPREGYVWTHPVHEVLTPLYEEKNVVIKDIVLNHHPDSSKSRGSYLELLELSVEEDPNDDRNMHYLGREYMYYNRWEDCINVLKRHLTLENATWNLERAASMRYIARSYFNLHNEIEAEFWYKSAIKEASNVREGYVELAYLYYNQKKWLDSINCLLKALSIKTKDMVYVNEIFCWDNTIDDLLSVNYFNLGIYDLALYHINKALEYNKEDMRLLENKKIIETSIKTNV